MRPFVLLTKSEKDLFFTTRSIEEKNFDQIFQEEELRKNMNKDVWFGYHLPPEGISFETIKDACLAAERSGLDLFTTTDHFMNMAKPMGKEYHPLECWSLLAALASVTNKIRLGPPRILLWL